MGDAEKDSRGLAPDLTRRVVTAIGIDGQSYLAEDGPSPSIVTVAGRPGYQNQNIWRTLGRVDSPDTIMNQQGVMPPIGGTVIRVVDFPPMPADPDERARQMAASFASVFPDAQHSPTDPRSSGMHITDTVDYGIVLDGEIVAIMEQGETTLRMGDILIQRGTNHAWENRTDRTTRMIFVLCDAQR